MSEYKLHILHCGDVRVDRALPFSNEATHPLSFTGLFRSSKKQIWLPVFAYLLECKKRLILFDSGWSRAMSPNGEYDKSAQIKHLGLMHYILNKGKIEKGKAIHEQLETKGIKPSDIDYALFSHLHSDHASGMKHIVEAKKILCSSDEWRDTQKYPHRYVSSMWDGVSVDRFDFKDSTLGATGRSFDLFGDGSLHLVNIPGHTNGMFAAVIFNKKREFVLLYFDGGYAKRSWQEMITPGTALDKKLARKSLEWIAKMSRDKSCLASFASHDVDVKAHVMEF